jgi:hypothetical protein
MVLTQTPRILADRESRRSVHLLVMYTPGTPIERPLLNVTVLTGCAAAGRTLALRIIRRRVMR